MARGSFSRRSKFGAKPDPSLAFESCAPSRTIRICRCHGAQFGMTVTVFQDRIGMALILSSSQERRIVEAHGAHLVGQLRHPGDEPNRCGGEVQANGDRHIDRVRRAGDAAIRTPAGPDPKPLPPALGAPDRRSQTRGPGTHTRTVRTDPLRALVVRGGAISDRFVEHLDAVRIERVGPGHRHRPPIGAELDAHDSVMPIVEVPQGRLRAEVVDVPVIHPHQTPTPQATQRALETASRTIDLVRTHSGDDPTDRSTYRISMTSAQDAWSDARICRESRAVILVRRGGRSTASRPDRDGGRDLARGYRAVRPLQRSAG